MCMYILTCMSRLTELDKFLYFGLWPFQQAYAHACSQTIHTYIYMFGILELRKRVTQNDVTLRVYTSKMFIEILLSSY